MLEKKEIPEFEYYAVTKEGQVWSKYHNIWLKPTFDSHRYFYVCLRKNKQSYNRSIHRLVLETFVGPCPDGMECRHLNGKKTDNRIGNLRWGTHRENIQDAIRHKVHRTMNQDGERNPSSKLTNRDVRMIIYMGRTGLFSHQEIADYYERAQTTISDIISKRTWKHLWTT